MTFGLCRLAALIGAALALSNTTALADPPPTQAPVTTVDLIDLFPERAADGLRLLDGYVAQTQAGPGRPTVRLFRQEAPALNHFVLLSTWKDRAALEAQGHTAAALRFRQALQPLLASPVDERTYTSAP